MSACSFRYRIDPEAGLALAELEGVVTGGDMLDAAQTLHADPDWHDGFDVLWDCSRVTKHLVGPEDVGPLLIEETGTGCGHDALVENERLGDTMISEMLTGFLRRRGKPAGVFHTRAEALKAIGREELPPSLRDDTTSASSSVS